MFETRTSQQSVEVTALAVLIVFDAVTFLLASASHLGEPIPLGFTTLDEPQIIPATIVEGLAGLFFVVSAFAFFSQRTWAWPVTLAAHIFSIVGVLVGIVALRFNEEQRTQLNDIYHLVMLAVLGIGVALLLVPDVRDALRDEDRDARRG